MRRGSAKIKLVESADPLSRIVSEGSMRSLFKSFPVKVRVLPLPVTAYSEMACPSHSFVAVLLRVLSHGQESS